MNILKEPITPAVAVSLSSLAIPVSGGIVSTTLLRRGGGNVTLFAFDEGQHLSQHTAPFDALVHVIEGTVSLTIGGQNVDAKAGDVVLMPANVPHGLVATTPMRMLLVMLRGEVFA